MVFHPNAGTSRLIREHNPYHDPKTGRFTTAQGAGLAGAIAVMRANTAFPLRGILKAMGPKFEADLTAIQAKTPEAHNALETGLTSVIRDLGGRLTDYTSMFDGKGIEAAMGPDKSARRIVEKAILDYDGDLPRVKDVVRATITVDNYDDVDRVRAAIRTHFEVTREKDRFADPTPEGYRDHMFNIRTPNGMIGEIQLHVRPMLKAKETEGHKLYAAMRVAMGNAAEKARVTARMAALYGGAWALALAINAGGPR